MDLIKQLEQEEVSRLAKSIPDFAPGDTVVVNVNVVEGDRKRVQAYEGVVIARRNRGLNSSFTVRKISSGEGVERTFQTYSPLIASVEVKRRGDVRRAKLLLPAEPIGQVRTHSREDRRYEGSARHRIMSAPRLGKGGRGRPFVCSECGRLQAGVVTGAVSRVRLLSLGSARIS